MAIRFDFISFCFSVSRFPLERTKTLDDLLSIAVLISDDTSSSSTSITSLSPIRLSGFRCVVFATFVN